MSQMSLSSLALADERSNEIEHEEEVESVKDNLVLLSDEEYSADFDENKQKSKEYQKFVDHNAFLKDVNSSLVEPPQFLFDKFMSAIKQQQEQYNGLVNKIDLLEDKIKTQSPKHLLHSYQELESRVSSLEIKANLLNSQNSTYEDNSVEIQDAIKKLESICANTVNGVHDVMHIIKSHQSSQMGLNQDATRPFSSHSVFSQNSRDAPTHKSDVFSDFQSDIVKHHNVGNDWTVKTPNKASRANSQQSSNSEQRAYLQNMLSKYIMERRQLEDKLLNSTNNSKLPMSQMTILDKSIADIRTHLERL